MKHRMIALAGVLLGLTAAPAAAEFTGLWTVEATVDGTPKSISCMLLQTGSALTGTCQSQGAGASELSGEVDGAVARWQYDQPANGDTDTVEYEAELESDGRLRGSRTAADSDATFVASRR